jgi:hypothetical protein
MAAAGGGGPSGLDFSNPLQALIVIAVVVLICWAVYRLVA